jgi:hypothetical protein
LSRRSSSRPPGHVAARVNVIPAWAMTSSQPRALPGSVTLEPGSHVAGIPQVMLRDLGALRSGVASHSDQGFVEVKQVDGH